MLLCTPTYFVWRYLRDSFNDSFVREDVVRLLAGRLEYLSVIWYHKTVRPLIRWIIVGYWIVFSGCRFGWYRRIINCFCYCWCWDWGGGIFRNSCWCKWWLIFDALGLWVKYLEETHLCDAIRDRLDIGQPKEPPVIKFAHLVTEAITFERCFEYFKNAC